MLIFCLWAALIVAICYPQTPIGKHLRLWLFEEPARLIANLKLSKIVGLAVFCIAVFAIAQAFPPELALLGAMDASAFTEIVAAVALLAVHLNARSLFRRLRLAAKSIFSATSSQARSRGHRRRNFGRAVARLRARIKLPPADEDGGPAGLWAV